MLCSDDNAMDHLARLNRELESSNPNPLPDPDAPKPKSCPHCGSIGVYVQGRWMSFVHEHVHNCPVQKQIIEDQNILISSLKETESALKTAVKTLRDEVFRLQKALTLAEDKIQEMTGPSV